MLCSKSNNVLISLETVKYLLNNLILKNGLLNVDKLSYSYFNVKTSKFKNLKQLIVHYSPYFNRFFILAKVNFAKFHVNLAVHSLNYLKRSMRLLAIYGR